MSQLGIVVFFCLFAMGIGYLMGKVYMKREEKKRQR